MTKLYMSEIWLRHQIWTKHKTPEEIAKELNVSHMTIRRWARKFGLIK